MTRLCLFEDDKYENFYPLSLTRPVYCLKTGMEEIHRRISRMMGVEVGGAMPRDYLARTAARSTGIPTGNGFNPREDDWLFLNGRVTDPSKLSLEGPEEAGIRGSDLVYVRASHETLEECWSGDLVTFLNRFLGEHDHVNVDPPMAGYIWDLVLGNSQTLRDDFKMLGKKGVEGRMAEDSYVVGDEADIFVAPTAEIGPLVVLDTTHGPIYIDGGVKIRPHTRVEGPCFVGRDTELVGGKIREGCSIGPVCRVGGEVEETIFQGFSNKYHDGFIGHSYVGEWVNLGALTTNSDLKNDYTTVQVFIKGRLVETDSPKIGSFIGDHVKTGIGSLLNSGTVVGVMSILMPSGEVFPKNIPSYCLLHKNRIRGGPGLEKLIQTARTAMSRRGVELTGEDVRVLKRVYEITSEDRESLIKRDRRKRARSS